jgi:dTDP-4-amino-4,6-dideoxygalactose transaminase
MDSLAMKLPDTMGTPTRCATALTSPVFTQREDGHTGKSPATRSAQYLSLQEPSISDLEVTYVIRAVGSGRLGSDGPFSQQCCRLLERSFGIHTVMLTPSCTSALELAVMLCDLQPEDEVLMPSFTFASTANAVLRAGGRPVFVEVDSDTLNVDLDHVAAGISRRSRVVLPVHYAGLSCDMDRLLTLAANHDLHVIEDSAQAVNSFYKNRALGSLGHLAAYSFHHTKNIICGEGGALCINDLGFVDRANILRDKGTNRRNFLCGTVDKYTWVDVGSSFIPSEVACALLLAQLERMDSLTSHRRSRFERYMGALAPLAERGLLKLPGQPEFATGNGHIFYVLLPSQKVRDALLEHLRAHGIGAAFHFFPLHLSPMGARLGWKQGDLPVTEDVSSRLLRLPLYSHLTTSDQEQVIRAVFRFLLRRNRPPMRRRSADVDVARCAPPNQEACGVSNGRPMLEYLEWDSQQFGMPVTRLADWVSEAPAVRAALIQARRKGVRLVYWFSDRSRNPSPHLLEEFSGGLVDRRVTFERSLGDADADFGACESADVLVFEHPVGPASRGLRELALRAGQYSRFRTDRRFPHACFRRLYETWLARSTRREIADIVFVARLATQSEVPAGLVTASMSGSVALIGLIAVREDVEHRGIGRRLLLELARWLAPRAVTRLRVVTQEENQAACRFYVRSKFTPAELEHVYHFWPCEPALPVKRRRQPAGTTPSPHEVRVAP